MNLSAAAIALLDDVILTLNAVKGKDPCISLLLVLKSLKLLLVLNPFHPC